MWLTTTGSHLTPKAEPFKRWLAKTGYERIREIENPELATKRTRAIYKAKGYSDDWIGKRMRSIAIRDELTDEWEKRGVKEQLEYAILTAEISEATFGLTPSQYVKFKQLKRENLRDHMTDLELIFSMLGEAATTEIARNRNAQGFPENKMSATAKPANKIDQFSPHLFWDVDRRELDLEKHRKFIVQRVLGHGFLNDWLLLRTCYALFLIVETAKTLRSLDPKTLAFIACVGKVPREDFRCFTKMQSSRTPWIP